MDKKIINYIVIVFFVIILAYGIGNTRQLNDTRRHLNTAREQLVRAEEYNQRLNDRLGNIAVNATKLGELTERNVSGVRDCVELVEEIRIGVKGLEDCIYGSDSIDDYYNYWDNEFCLQ